MAVLLVLPRAPAPTNAGTHSIVDENGRTVRLTPGPRRALYMGTGAGEYLLTTRRPKGLTTSRSPTNERLLASSLMARAVPGIASVRLRLSSSEGAAANLETLLRERPDLLVTWGRLVDRFARVGIPAVGLRPVATPAQFADHARLYGGLTDEADRATAIVTASNAIRAQVAHDVVAHVRGRTRLAVLYPSGAGYRSNYEYPEIVDAAGGVDLVQALDRSTALDAERLIRMAPDVIVIVGGGDVADDAALRLMADSRLGAVPAVAARRVYRRPPGLSGYMGSAIELPIYQRWLAEVLHPDALRAETRGLAIAVIQRALGTTPTAAELDDVLGVHANRGSAHAARFAAAT